MDASNQRLVEVRNLSVFYKINYRLIAAVDNVSLDLHKGKIQALIGESGCGKSTLGLALSRLLAEDRVRYSGEIRYKGVNLLSLSESEAEKFRGTEIANIFQEPMTCLNPVYKVGEQIAEAMYVSLQRRSLNGGDRAVSASQNDVNPSNVVNGKRGRMLSLLRRGSLYKVFSDQVDDLLDKVKLPDTKRVANMYPHELSGGMRQRVMIAMALAESPSLLVADEPTTALDVTTQAQILNLIRSLKEQYNMGVLIITHDLGVVGSVAERAAVMYAGKIVEEAPTDELFRNPLHPYTIGLMSSFPRERKDAFKLSTIPGSVPPLGSYPNGCRFHPRCVRAFAPCPKRVPETTEVSPDHRVACYLYG